MGSELVRGRSLLAVSSLLAIPAKTISYVVFSGITPSSVSRIR